MRLPAGLGVAALVVAVTPPTPGTAQQTDVTLSGYGLNVGTYSDGSRFSGAGAADIQRLRGMLEASLGRFELDVAYEHTALVREAGAGIAAAGLRLPGSVGNWWDLDWTLDSGEDWSWSHRFDRLAGTVALAEKVEVTVGRQVISWASTLLLTPADPFTPFDPADPFRDYRAGVDAVRLRWYVGPFSELEVVVRPTRDVTQDRLTALVRGRTSVGGWDLSAWSGALYDAAAAGVAAVGSIGPWAVRGEGSLRDEGGEVSFRGALGVDRRTTFLERDLYVVMEYRRDGFGAAEGEIGPLLTSAPALRGELQLVSKDAGALQFSLQVHPLVSVSLLTLVSLNDESGLVGPGVGWSVGSNSTVTAGAFLAWGTEGTTGLESEFGAVPAVGYASITFFF
jgi:hypothetical protein